MPLSPLLAPVLSLAAQAAPVLSPLPAALRPRLPARVAIEPDDVDLTRGSPEAGEAAARRKSTINSTAALMIVFPAVGGTVAAILNAVEGQNPIWAKPLYAGSAMMAGTGIMLAINPEALGARRGR